MAHLSGVASLFPEGATHAHFPNFHDSSIMQWNELFYIQNDIVCVNLYNNTVTVTLYNDTLPDWPSMNMWY